MTPCGGTPTGLRLYRPRVSTLWWTRKRTYFVFVMRELSSIFVAWFVIYLVVLSGLAFPLGWLDPRPCALLAVLTNPLTFVVLLGSFVLMLVHSAHRFRYTLHDGLQIKMKRTVAVLTYGAAILGSVATLGALWVAAQAL